MGCLVKYHLVEKTEIKFPAWRRVPIYIKAVHEAEKSLLVPREMLEKEKMVRRTRLKS